MGKLWSLHTLEQWSTTYTIKAQKHPEEVSINKHWNKIYRALNKGLLQTESGIRTLSWPNSQVKHCKKVQLFIGGNEWWCDHRWFELNLLVGYRSPTSTTSWSHLVHSVVKKVNWWSGLEHAHIHARCDPVRQGAL